jgi:hypothetical protein
MTDSNRKHATMYDFRDLDLMLKIEQEGDDLGWVESAHLARSIGFGDDVQPLAIRLSWMKRFGMIEFDPSKRMWRLSPGGQRVSQARLKAAAAREIQALPDEAMIEVMANVTTRYWRGDAMTAAMLRREFLYGTRRR